MLFFIGQILPYLSVGIFLIGMIWRIGLWLRVPIPFSLTLSPEPATVSGRMLKVAKELFLFRSLWVSNKFLWLGAWLMHIALGMTIIGHIIGISSLGLQFMFFGVSAMESKELSAGLATGVGLALVVAIGMLLYRRIGIVEIRRLSDPVEYFDLLLLLGIVISGLYMRVTLSEGNLVVIRMYMEGLLTFYSTPILQDWAFISHFLLVNILLIYIPFSKLMHFVGGFMNQSMLVAASPTYPSPYRSSKLSKVSHKVNVWEGGE